jgi:hypothetical protein
MSAQYIWDKITNTADSPLTKLVYLGIGSSMECYSEITTTNNQQYPCFLDKFEDNKVIVLFDTRLETPLKIEDYFERKKDQLDMIDSIVSENGTFIFREFQNNSGSVKVYAVNENFNFEYRRFGHLDENDMKVYNENVDITTSNLFNLIGTCLGKHTKTKLILQDYSGRPTVSFYVSLLKSFDKDEMLSNVIFDVTQRDPGCFFVITPEYPTLDASGNFVQENYIQLKQIRKYPLYNHVLKQRIDQLVYPLSSNYVKLSQDPAFELAGMDKISNLCTIYSVEFNDTIQNNGSPKNRDYLLAKFMELIKIMLNDIIRSQDCDVSYIEHFIQLMSDRNAFINSMSVLKYSD